MWAANCEKQPREFVKGAKLEVEKIPWPNMKPMDMNHWKWVVPIAGRERDLADTRHLEAIRLSIYLSGNSHGYHLSYDGKEREGEMEFSERMGVSAPTPQDHG